VFAITLDGVETVLYSFQGGSDGATPVAGLLAVGGTLYGTTVMGGGTGCNFGCGTVFSVTTSGTERVLYRFQGGADGAEPVGSLIDLGGTFYGTTYVGGGTSCLGSGIGCGTVFSIIPGAVETIVYSFKGGSDGANPIAGPIAVGGSLYGTTWTGGTGCSNQCGTVYKVTPGGVETVLHSFTRRNGYGSTAPLLNVSGILYGTTSSGGGVPGCGRPGCGAVFKITRRGLETVLHLFNVADGARPSAGLINVGGTLYGTTGRGGTHNQGTVFKIIP
jgi:uncharacterized repeat protein (TIGR03803 family)